MLGCLGAQEKTYARGEVIYHAGQHIGRMGLLLEGGALGAVMSGSGSAVYGVFDDEERATDAARSAKNVCREVFLTSTV